MILKKRKIFWMLAIMTMMVCFQMASASATVLELNDQTAAVGDDVTFTVSVKDAPSEAFAFGFDILYDPNVLSFSQHERGDLVQEGFDYFGVNELSSGTLRVGGAEVNDAGIPQNAEGSLVALTFKVIKNTGCNLTVTAAEDDVKGWTARNGKFAPAFPDVWIADPAPDTGIEPNTVSQRIWCSPAVWVRNQNDGVYQYQNVKYGQDNYVYVRVKNIGNLTATDTTVEVYRIDSSMGSGWPKGWKSVGEAVIEDLGAGKTQDVVITWDKAEIPKPGHYCFYVRLINADDPMTIPEGSNAVRNTFNNNNIAWRNFNVVGLLDKVTDAFDVNVGNPKDQPATIDIVFEEEEGLLQNEGTSVIVDLGLLFQRWVNAGTNGENFKILGGTEIRILKTPAKFFGIAMQAEETQTIRIRTQALKPIPVDGISVEYRFSTQEFIIGELIGGVDYTIITRALGTDTDNDGEPDITDPDDDNDGMSDVWEIEYGLNPLVDEASEDTDNDGYTNIDEYKAGTDPNDADSYPISLCSDPANCPEFKAGVFVVKESGKVKVDWLYDGGAYKSEFGIFSLAGMDDIVPNSTEFIAEAVRRVLSCSELGYVVISDAKEGARFSGTLGNSKEYDHNHGEYKGIKSFAMTPGDKLAAILIPNSTFTELEKNPGTNASSKKPIFSLASSNPAHKLYFGQFAKIVDKKTGYEAENVFAFEDMAIPGSDRDYNDLVVQITGVTVTAPTLDNPELGFKNDWRKTDDMIVPHISVSPPNPDTLWITITLMSPADLIVYDPSGRFIGKEGGYIPGSTFEFDENGHQIVTLPALESGNYRVVLQGIGEGGLCHLEVKGFKGDAELAVTNIPFEIKPHQTLVTRIPADTFIENQTVDFKTPDLPVSVNGMTLVYDFDGNGRIDIYDIMKVSSRWDSNIGNEDYDAFYDFDDSGSIRLNDIMKVVNSADIR